MKNSNKWVSPLSAVFISFSLLSLAWVSVLAMISPQHVMDLVSVKLENTDAISSIRGIYGGVGITICALLAYLLMKDKAKALLFLSVFWGMYALSRFVTILVDGSLGDFGKQWIAIESVFSILAIVLFMVHPKMQKV
jgi:hypothetical protein